MIKCIWTKQLGLGTGIRELPMWQLVDKPTKIYLQDACCKIVEN